MKKMSLVFVDFDKTLIVKDSATLCAWATFKEGLITPSYFLRLALGGLLYGLGLRSRDHIQRIALQCYQGHSRQAIEAWIKVIIQSHIVPALSQTVLDELAKHRAQGLRIIVASAAAQHFVTPISEALDIIDDAIGSPMEFDALERCTGQVLGPVLDGEAKKTAAYRYAQRLGVPLSDCYFYSDHIADLPLLESVGMPVVVSPGKKLRALALERKWRILTHRQREGKLGRLSCLNLT